MATAVSAPEGSGAAGPPTRKGQPPTVDRVTWAGLAGVLREQSWSLNCYIDAREAGGSYRGRPKERDPNEPPRVRDGLGPIDPVRSQAESARRARAHLRRFCASHRLIRMLTTTYAEANHCPTQVREDAAAFFKALRYRLGGNAFPYAFAPELHPGGHGFHLHAAVGAWIPRSTITAAWGRGFTNIRLISHLPVGSGRVGEARVVGNYMGKVVGNYLGKDLGRNVDGTDTLGVSRLKHQHAYEVAQGYPIRTIRLNGPTSQSVLEQANEQMGGKPHRIWRSDENPDWDGPPVLWAQWPG